MLNSSFHATSKYLPCGMFDYLLCSTLSGYLWLKHMLESWHRPVFNSNSPEKPSHLCLNLKFYYLAHGESSNNLHVSAEKLNRFQFFLYISKQWKHNHCFIMFQRLLLSMISNYRLSVCRCAHHDGNSVLFSFMCRFQFYSNNNSILSKYDCSSHTKFNFTLSRIL